MGNDLEATSLQQSLAQFEHIVQNCSDMEQATKLLWTWHPDLLITEESIGRFHPQAGLRLAETCRNMHVAIPPVFDTNFATKVVLLVPVNDWSRIRRARSTGAHVLVKSANYEKVVRYIQTLVDDLITDRMLGPVLFGFHGFRGSAPDPKCNRCTWLKSGVMYDVTDKDLDLPPIQTALLNALLMCRRGQSPGDIEIMIKQSPFFRQVLKKQTLRSSAVKMNITRLRKNIGIGLQEIGAPYDPTHFLPWVQYGIQRYHLAGNWYLIHVPLNK